MTLYHFCSDKHVKKILRQGLTIGYLTEPTPQGFIIHKGWIWLTTNLDPKNQSWATRNVVKYIRTAYRLKIDIPDSELDRMYDREKLTALYPSCGVLFDGWPGSENWRVFKGIIHKEWIVDYGRSI